MSIMTPTPRFASYVQDAISDELNKAHPAPVDVMKRRLWEAAQYDHYTKTGAICSMVDDGGLARVDCSQYGKIINPGLAHLTRYYVAVAIV